MLTAYALTAKGAAALPEVIAPAGDPRVGWVDVLAPTPDEDRAAEHFLGASIPTREEAQEIEFSSRFYQEAGATYLTVSIVAGISAGKPGLTPLTLVLSGGKLATVRYDDFAAFRQFLTRSKRVGDAGTDATGTALDLMDAIVDRAADVVERIGLQIDKLNQEIFGQGGFAHTRGIKKRERRLERYLEELGAQNDVISKVSESLSSIERMLQYVAAIGLKPNGPGSAAQVKLMVRDVRSLTEHLTFLSDRATFLLEATLGLISVQQNDVIRGFTALATILLPPTLIGTIYGMNFNKMPELDWAFGYPAAIVLMIASAVIPYLILKRRGWF